MQPSTAELVYPTHWRNSLLCCLLGIILVESVRGLAVGNSHDVQVYAEQGIAQLGNSQVHLDRRALRKKRHPWPYKHQHVPPQATQGPRTTLPGFKLSTPVFNPMVTGYQQRMTTHFNPTSLLLIPKWWTTRDVPKRTTQFNTMITNRQWNWQSSKRGPTAWGPVHTNPHGGFQPQPKRTYPPPHVISTTPHGQSVGADEPTTNHYVIIICVTVAVVTILIIFGIVAGAFVLYRRKPRPNPADSEKSMRMSNLPPPEVYNEGLRELKEGKAMRARDESNDEIFYISDEKI